jgi:RHS repeat-associated protein
MTVTQSQPCGTQLGIEYGVDSQYRNKYLSKKIRTTPAGLEKTIQINKDYQDTNADGTSDLMTETIEVNGKSVTIANDILSSLKVVTTPEGRTVTFDYDPTNLLTLNISPPGLNPTGFGYDPRGRLTSVTNGTRQTIYTYNDQGFLDSITDPENHTTSYSYDAVGRVTGVDRPDGSSIGFAYDANGNMTVLTNPDNVDHAFTYNKVNRADGNLTPISGSYSYVYDTERRLTQTLFPSGRQINNIYTDSQLTQIQTPEGDIGITYGCGGYMDTMSAHGESMAYTYDGNLLTSATYSGTLNQPLSYTYNDDFDVILFDYAGGTQSYSYDLDGLLTGVGGYTITRNAQNGLPEAVSGAGLNIDRTFNGYGELASQSVSVNSQPVVAWTLTRDDNGRITDKTETVEGQTNHYVYTYDAVGRLLTVSKDGGLVEEYGYDIDGTRTFETNTLRGITGRSLSYSDEDHLLAAGDVVYSYDLDGFLSAKTEPGQVTTYACSSRGELQQVQLPDGRIISYDHDPLGRRIAKHVDGVTVEKYLWQGRARLLAVYDGSDILIQRFEYADGRMPVSMTMSGVIYTLAYDQVGSLRVVADGAGSVIKRIDYDTFGNIVGDTNSSLTVPFGFSGGLHDRDVGLVRFGYRDYDPNTGRWTAKDPIGFAGGDTDLYGYVQNNPVNFIDPTGEFLISGTAAVGYAGYVVGTAIAAGVVYYGAPIAADIGEWLGNKLWNENTEDGADDGPCPKDEDLADDIAEHAQKHNPRIPTDELSELIKDTIGRGEKKDLERGRRAYNDPLTGRVVIVDPSSPDKGTSFIPESPGYFDGLK